MTKIMHNRTQYNGFGVRSPSPTTIPLLSDKRSLNKGYRRKELLKITMENQAILRRLQDKSSSYSVLKWEENFKDTKKYSRNISEYPLNQTTSSAIGLRKRQAQSIEEM
jgi:hypothetical protein